MENLFLLLVQTEGFESNRQMTCFAVPWRLYHVGTVKETLVNSCHVISSPSHGMTMTIVCFFASQGFEFSSPHAPDICIDAADVFFVGRRKKKQM